MTFYPLEKIHRLVEGYRRVFRVAGQNLLLLEHGGVRYLIENRCPHAGHPLQESTITERGLRCPLHGIEFRLQDGRAVNAASLSSVECLRFYKIVYRDDVAGVEC